MFLGNCLCTCLLRASEILFTNIQMRNNLYQLYFIYFTVFIPGCAVTETNDYKNYVQWYAI